MKKTEFFSPADFKILIVDDEPTNLLLITHYLKNNDYSVCIAENGATGLEVARQQQPDLILLDIQMPVMDGFAVCNELKSADATSHIPVIFMTALSGQENRIKGFELGAVDYVIKPVIRQELLARISVHLQMRKLTNDLQGANASMETLVKIRTAELEKVNAELLKAGSFNQQVIDSIDEGVVIYGPDLRYRFFNSFMEQISGFSTADAIGRTTFDIFPLMKGSLVEENLHRALNGNSPPGFDMFISHTSTWVSIKFSPICDAKREIIGVLGIATDITERKVFEEHLRKLSMIVEQIPETIVITDTSGVIEYVNSRFSELTGYSYLEAIGQNPRMFKAEDTPEWVYRDLWETISSGMVWKGELHNRKKNGELFWEQATIAPFRNTDGSLKGYIAIKEDVTARKELQRQLEQSQKMEAIGLLAGGIAHDFNNILTVIHGFCTIMQMDLDKNDPNQENLHEVVTAAERAGELTNSLLAFSRKQVLNIHKVELKSVITDVGKLLRRIIGEDIRLEIVFKGEQFYVDIDITRISQVLINLATNARDAMPRGGRLSIEVEPVQFGGSELYNQNLCPIGTFILIKVSDTGSGIQEDILDKIFEPFYTSKHADKGTGLGLSIVYGIVMQHNGYITVNSRLGSGSTFNIYLPVSRVDSTEKQLPPKLEQFRRGDETILVADDEPATRAFLYKLLSKYGYQVILAENGLDAVGKYEADKNNIAMVILDVMMPGISGKEALDRMRVIKPDLKALFLSGYEADLLQKKYDLQENYELLNKPVYAVTLLDKVRDVLDR